jgi:hypothetical protein
MNWEHVLVISSNLMLVTLFQSLFFVYYAYRMMIRKLREENSQLWRAGSTCSLFVPGFWSASVMGRVAATDPGGEESEELRAVREAREAKNRKIHWVLFGIVCGLFGIMMLAGVMGVHAKQFAWKDVAVNVGAGLLGFVSEIAFFFFVIKPSRFFTIREFLEAFSKGHQGATVNLSEFRASVDRDLLRQAIKTD